MLFLGPSLRELTVMRGDAVVLGGGRWAVMTRWAGVIDQSWKYIFGNEYKGDENYV